VYESESWEMPQTKFQELIESKEKIIAVLMSGTQQSGSLAAHKNELQHNVPLE